MWNPNKIVLKNLITHEDTTFKLEKNKCLMIFGINSTDVGADSNGGGKSTVLEAITLALTGETNRDVNKEEFIMDGADNCSVEAHFTNEVGDINSLVIKRWFDRKKSAKVEIYENGEKNNEITSVLLANKRIYELIGLSKEDLLHFFLVGQETNYSFLTANDGDKKDIISRFSDTEFISKKIEELKKRRKTHEDELDSHSRGYQKLENKLEFLTENLQEIVDNFEATKKDKIKKINDKIETENENKKTYKTDIKKLNTKISEVEAEIEEFKKIDTDVKKLRAELKIENDKISGFEKEITSIEHSISHLETIFDGKVECPKCSHEFSVGQDIELSEIPTMISQLNEEILYFNNAETKVEKKIKTIKQKITQAQDTIDEIEDRNSSIKSLKLKLKNIKELQGSSDSKIADFEKEIMKLNKNSLKSETAGIKAEMKELLTEIKKSLQEKEIIDNNILDIDFWVYHFGKKGFMTFLTNKSIKSIEGITNSYLKKMNSEIQILIDGFTFLKSNEVREKINISVLRNGDQLASFNRYSGGEKGRIKLANILGLQHLINLTAKNGGLNFLGLDEVFEGLDRTGQIDILNVLENLKVTSLVITHRNQPIGASNEIFIEKKGGISRIVDKEKFNLQDHEESIKRSAEKNRRKTNKNKRD